MLHGRNKKDTIMKTLPNNFYVYPHIATTTIENKELKELLLETEGWVMACGRIWNIMTKQLNTDVYKIWLERSN